MPRSRPARAVLAGVTALVLAGGGGTAWALDRYVVDHVEIADVDAYEAAQSGATTAPRDDGAVTVTDSSYVSDDASVTISRYTTGSGDATVTYFVADVLLTDATRLRSAFAQNRFGTNIVQNTSGIAADNDAVFAINGDIQGAQPRTAVGVVGDNHLLFVVVDGRSPGYSSGLTMTGLAQLMQSLGAKTAYNIDGGGSSTMVFDGAVVNNPLGKGTERGTSDILYIER